MRRVRPSLSLVTLGGHTRWPFFFACHSCSSLLLVSRPSLKLVTVPDQVLTLAGQSPTYKCCGSGPHSCRSLSVVTLAGHSFSLVTLACHSWWSEPHSHMLRVRPCFLEATQRQPQPSRPEDKKSLHVVSVVIVPSSITAQHSKAKQSTGTSARIRCGGGQAEQHSMSSKHSTAWAQLHTSGVEQVGDHGLTCVVHTNLASALYWLRAGPSRG